MITTSRTIPMARTFVLALSLAGWLTVGAFTTVQAQQTKDPDALKMVELEPTLDTEGDESQASATSSNREPLTAKAVVVDINSQSLNYDKDRDVYIATGAVQMVISEQNSEMFADKVTYDQNQNLVIAEGNVVIIKDGQKTHGVYAKIDLGRKSALINDYRATVEKVRIKSQKAFVDSRMVQYENGRIILSPEMLRAAVASTQGPGKGNTQRADKTGKINKNVNRSYGEESLEKLALSHQPGMETQELEGTDPFENTGDGFFDKMDMHVKQIDIHRDEHGYSKIYAKHPSLKLGKFRVPMPNAEFSFDAASGEMEYLGPDIGYDRNLGGLYFGPGWDFKVGDHGSLRVSPLITMGNSAKTSGGRFESTGFGPGVGGLAHYRAPGTILDVGYNSRVGQPVVLGEKLLFGGTSTMLRASAYQDYVNGFLGTERPQMSAMLTDTRKIAEFGKFRVDSFESAGYFKDEFFPTQDANYFVKPKDEDAEPIHAGRMQLQASFRNTQPLLQVGNFLDFGLRADMAVSAYTTGDLMGLIRGGPTVNLKLGNRFLSSMNYYYAAVGGETPFVFDSYYRGRQSVSWVNSFKVNNNLTLGLRQDISLLRDNAQDAMFTGNQIFMLFGPDSMKFNVAYDVVRKRSFFGINFIPGQQSGRPVDFDTLRIFQPENYNGMGMIP